ncbi:hypothetical protein EDB89DRAFT_2073019 [Lactarius sanguifluus]|nr:hypothetical protein EDB89DRAFT_2073019 [Lactarius sanguifluus]
MRFSSFLLFPVLSVLATALAETITLRRDVGFYENSLDTFHHTPHGHSTTADDALEVLNVVLLWSMPSSPPPSSTQTVPAILEPLISTKHLDADPDLGDDSFAHETYIVEPQSGDIYVSSSSSPTAPLQRLPLSMTQLVDRSPFSFGEADGRSFVGSKKTSILLLELETGRVKAALDSECPWDAWNDFSEQDVMDIDLDELEGIKPSRLYPSEIFIGRTVPQIIVFLLLPVHHHNLRGFSICRSPRMGPITKISSGKAAYRRSVDDLYVEPLPNGEVISFKSNGDISPTTTLRENQPVWGQKFSNPIVAIFDVVKSARRTSPFVLLQPRLRLRDIIPTTRVSAITPTVGPPLSVLSPKLALSLLSARTTSHSVAFSGPVSTQQVEGTSDEGVLISHEDGKLQCYEGTTDRRCQTGVRTLGADGVSRIARLLDGVPSPEAPALPSATGSDSRPWEYELANI